MHDLAHFAVVQALQLAVPSDWCQSWFADLAGEPDL